MKNLIIHTIIALIFISSTEAYYPQNKTVIIGTKIAEPFVFQKQEGKWEGLSFDLWRSISEDLKYKYEIKQYGLEELVTAVSNGEIDAAIAPLTITAEREARMDFTQPYYVTGLGIAVAQNSSGNLIDFITRFFSIEFFEIVFILAVLLFIVGFLTWLFERKDNHEQFGDGKTKGLGSSFWWAAVTMTTVGYGDKAPKTVGGRIVALVWMFGAIIVISSFTAAIASALTADRLDSYIRSANDLKHVSVGTVANSSSEKYLISNQVNYILFKNINDAIEALAAGRLDAVVHDSPIIKYIIKKNYMTGLSVLPINLEPLYYGFAVPQGSKLREDINRVLIQKITSPEWKNVLFNYFGE